MTARWIKSRSIKSQGPEEGSGQLSNDHVARSEYDVCEVAEDVHPGVTFGACIDGLCNTG